jgi:predicted acyl esterase
VKPLVVAAVFAWSAWGSPAVAQGVPAAYRFRTERGWLRMPDGVRLAVTYWRPIARREGERFPVLLEYLPYREEDSFYQRAFPIYSWFVRRGFILAAVDVRGTGSSEGRLPPREYSDEEMRDADEIIAQLARVPESNGRVGMWGISWGGFNSIQVAMRRPPARHPLTRAALKTWAVVNSPTSAPSPPPHPGPPRPPRSRRTRGSAPGAASQPAPRPASSGR